MPIFLEVAIYFVATGLLTGLFAWGVDYSGNNRDEALIDGDELTYMISQFGYFVSVLGLMFLAICWVFGTALYAAHLLGWGG